MRRFYLFGENIELKIAKYTIKTCLYSNIQEKLSAEIIFWGKNQ